MKQSNKTVIRNDIIVIVTALVIALVFFVFSLIFSPKADGETAVISLEGEIIGEYSLSEDISLPIYDKSGEFLLTFNVKDGKAYVTDSVCNDHSCERMGPISRSGESIICLVSRLTVTIEGKSQDIDAVAHISWEVKKRK
ncbi:MAG: NusG domain II-containing protein [Ruminococcaceae bacterium]|nr:NusG domain II-containing protein [Oscillospiraceae bacterium]